MERQSTGCGKRMGYAGKNALPDGNSKRRIRERVTASEGEVGRLGIFCGIEVLASAGASGFFSGMASWKEGSSRSLGSSDC